MFGVNTLTPVNQTSVDYVETTLRNKVETSNAYKDNPPAAIQQMFGQFDKDRSGKLSLDEFLAGMKKMDFDRYEADCTALFKRYDLDRSGFLTTSEFANSLFGRGDAMSRATSIIGKIREVLATQAGGFSALEDLARQFRIMDRDRSGTLSREELQNGLNNFLRSAGYALNKAEINRLFAAFDRNGDGQISQDEFVRAIRGDMNERRQNLVGLAFNVLDANRDHVITVEEVCKRIDLSTHPKVLRGETTIEKLVQDYLKTWDANGDHQVTWEEFLENYQWISANIDNDDYFELMIRNAWHISGGEGWAANTSNRRVLVFHRNGRQSVEEIKDDFGIQKTDIKAMMENLRQQGFDPVKIELYGSA